MKNMFKRALDVAVVQESSTVLSITPAQQLLLDAAESIRVNPDAAERAYMARQLVQCTLPHRDPGDVQAWSRTNGNFAFAIQPGVDAFTGKTVGVPYGTLPRLLLFWVTTEAVRSKSPVLELGATLSMFMRDLGLDPSRGGKRSDAYRLKEQATRLFAAKVTFQQRFPADRRDMQIGSAQLWWNPRQPDQGTLWGSRIVLSAEFFVAITSAPVPLDTRALRALKRSPLALDLYSLLTYQSFIAGKKQVEQIITWSDLQRQFGADYNNVHDLKRKVSGALRKVQTVMPGLRIRRRVGGFTVLPTSIPAITPR
jgi:hypothetical protein